MIARSPIRKVRSKARPGRLKGKAMKALRQACFDRDTGACQGCGALLCWETMHLAHIGAKRRYGDSLDNVRALCGDCHRSEHNGGKVVPAKEAINA
jgi:5-methylcytosine-specific restriction endonuclease McrA